MNEPRLRAILEALGIEVLSKTTTGWLVSRCPLSDNHKGGIDHNPSFNAHVNNGGLSGYHCFSCGSKGRITRLIRLLEEMRGESLAALYMQAVMDETPDSFGEFEEAAEDYHGREPEPLNQAQFDNLYQKAWANKKARAYLKARGITESACETLELVYDDRAREQRILFPVYGASRDELFGFSGRTILPKSEWPKPREGERPYSKVKDYGGLQKRFFLLGEHLWQKGKPAFVIEGLMGMAYLVSINALKHCNPLALLGSVLTTYKRDRILDHGYPTTYLMLDDDLAGDIGLYGKMVNGKHAGGGAIDMLKNEVDVRVPLYPKGVDDIDNLTEPQLVHIIKKDYRRER